MSTGERLEVFSNGSLIINFVTSTKDAATLAQQQTDVDCPLQEQLLLKLLEMIQYPICGDERGRNFHHCH